MCVFMTVCVFRCLRRPKKVIGCLGAGVTDDYEPPGVSVGEKKQCRGRRKHHNSRLIGSEQAGSATGQMPVCGFLLCWCWVLPLGPKKFSILIWSIYVFLILSLLSQDSHTSSGVLFHLGPCSSCFACWMLKLRSNSCLNGRFRRNSASRGIVFSLKLFWDSVFCIVGCLKLCITKDELEVVIFLPLSPEFWDYKYTRMSSLCMLRIKPRI